MFSDFEKVLSGYDYVFPEKLIANEPASPRDSARLMVYSKKEDNVSFAIFRNLPGLLPPRSLLVFNESKVVPARFTLQKGSGGSVKVLYVGAEENFLKVMSDRRLDPGMVLSAASGDKFKVARQDGKYFFLLPDDRFFSDGDLNIRAVHGFLFEHGETPLPPYIKNSPLPEKKLREEYQSVFASEEGSVAAPTASLHFTEKLLRDLKDGGHDIAFTTLHVGLGTFAPLSEENMVSGKLHEEWYAIPPETIGLLEKARTEKLPVIAVGTTCVRALESAAGDDGKIIRPEGTTDIFIREGYRFKMVKGLITNFHVPRSSLMMLVAAIVGRKKLLELYESAIEGDFRLFSFGDGMLIKDFR